MNSENDKETRLGLYSPAIVAEREQSQAAVLKGTQEDEVLEEIGRELKGLAVEWREKTEELQRAYTALFISLSCWALMLILAVSGWI